MSPESQAPDGAEPLEPKREAFVRNLFEGVEINQAYEQAGYKRPRGNAWRMYRDPAVQTRLEFLRRELDDMEMANRAWRRRELRKMLEAVVYLDRTNMFEEVTHERMIGKGENATTVSYQAMEFKSRDKLSEQERLLFEGVGDGGRVVLPSKLSAAAQLARLDGLEAAAKNELSGPDGAPITIERIERVIVDPADRNAEEV